MSSAFSSPLPSALLATGVLFATAAHAQCPAPDFLEPTERVIAETRPLVAWSPVAGADSYALRVLSRVPEGRVVASHDVSVAGTSFLPPAALADEKAKVTVSIAARCGGSLSPPRATWFIVDATRRCTSPGEVRLSLQDGRLEVRWAPTQGADRYELRVHSPLDGRVLATLEAREPRATLEGSFPPAGVLGVRPRCGNVYGEVAYRVLAQ